MATKTASYKGLAHLHLVTDNASAIWSNVRNKTGTARPAETWDLEHIAHTL